MFIQLIVPNALANTKKIPEAKEYILN